MARPRKETVAEHTPVATPSVRKKRTPVGSRNVLTVEGKDPDYVYRFVNDVGDRIPQFLDAGYELVDAATHRVGDRRVNSASAEGSHAQATVGLGQKAFVMRIHKDLYAEDQKTKQEHVDKLERSLQNPDGADYGKLTIDKSGARK